jgi:hypothetical protein
VATQPCSAAAAVGGVLGGSWVAREVGHDASVAALRRMTVSAW